MPLNVLLTSASRRVPLVRAFRRGVGSFGGRVVVSDVNSLSPAVHTADAAYRVPLPTGRGYLDAILNVCRIERIGLIVPTVDDELPLFGAAAPMFESLGVRIASSTEATATLCNDKFALCRHLRARGIAAAESWLPSDLPQNPRFPLFIKPRHGSGALETFAIRTPRELDFFLGYVSDPVVQEFLIGPEFTIDVLCGFDSAPLAVVPRERVVIRAGVSDRGRTVGDPALVRLALNCAAAIDFVGPLNIQCRMVDGQPIVFEINPRFSDGIALTIAAGADFPRLLVDLARGRDVGNQIGRFQADLWMTNYEEAMYLDQEAAVVPVSGEELPMLAGVPAIEHRRVA